MELITGVYVNELEYLVDANIPVFPVWWLKEDGSCGCGGKPNCKPGKHPITEHGLDDATTDKIQIQKWMIRYPKAGWAMRTGDGGAFVIDIEFDGYDSWNSVVGGQEVPNTVAVKTRRGGMHLWFKMPEGVDLRNSTEKLAENIDTRGNRGYVLIPPSQGYEYLASVVDHPIADMPAWLLAKLVQPPKPSKNGHHKGMRNLTREREVAKAKDALTRIPCDMADNYEDWVKVGMMLKSLGDDGLALWDEWSQQSPKYVEGDCDEKWATFKAEGVTLGSLFYLAGDANETDDDEITPRFTWVKFRDAVKKQAPIDYLIEDFIQEGTITSFVGDGGSKKTYLNLALGVSVAAGIDFCGKKIKQCPVMFIEEEMGAQFINNRVAWIANGLGVTGDIPFYLSISAGLDLLDSSDSILLESEIKRMGVKLVIIDAQSDVMPGGDENSSKDVTRLYLHIRQIAKNTGCAFSVIHHANKNGGYRGSTDIKNKGDYMWIVQSGIDDTLVAIKPEKRRDGKFDLGYLDFHLENADHSHPEGGKVWFSRPEGNHTRYDHPSKLPNGKSMGKGHEYVLRRLHQAKPDISVRDIMDGADTCAGNTARQCLYDLVSCGLAYRTNTGSKGSDARYALVNSKDDDDWDED